MHWPRKVTAGRVDGDPGATHPNPPAPGPACCPQHSPVKLGFQLAHDGQVSVHVVAIVANQGVRRHRQVTSIAAHTRAVGRSHRAQLLLHMQKTHYNLPRAFQMQRRVHCGPQHGLDGCACGAAAGGDDLGVRACGASFGQAQAHHSPCSQAQHIIVTHLLEQAQLERAAERWVLHSCFGLVPSSVGQCPGVGVQLDLDAMPRLIPWV